jgi:hypothetical protein
MLKFLSLFLGLKKLGVILLAKKVAGGADVDISDVNKCIYLIWAKGKRYIYIYIYIVSDESLPGVSSISKQWKVRTILAFLKVLHKSPILSRKPMLF